MVRNLTARLALWHLQDNKSSCCDIEFSDPLIGDSFSSGVKSGMKVVVRFK